MIKKNLFIILVLSILPFLSNAQCDYYHSLPISEGFESATFPPSCWEINPTKGSPWQRSSSQKHGGSYSAYHSWGGNPDGWLITPQFLIPNIGSVVLKFWSYTEYPQWYHKSSIWVSTSGKNPGDFVEIKALSGSEVTNAWQEITVPITGFEGEAVYVAFRHQKIGNDHGWYIDDVSIEAISDVPVITTHYLPQGVNMLPYSQNLRAAGDIPITWSIEAGSLPTGLSIIPSTGLISGTPSEAGIFNFTAKAQNSLGFDTKDYTVEIREPFLPVVTTASMKTGYDGAIYTQTLTATGDTPITWSIVSGSLPPGLTLTSSTGLIVGIPSSTNTYNFTARATNFAGYGDKELSITLLPTPTYDPTAVEIINDLIANNGLQATPNDPENWTFASWSTDFNQYFGYEPLLLSALNVSNQNLTGVANLSGINDNLDLVSPGAHYNAPCLVLNCTNNNLTGADITNTDFGFFCGGEFLGWDQTLSLTLTESAPGEYTTNIQFFEPKFTYIWDEWLEVEELSYSNGILKSTDYTITEVKFQAQNVSGTIYFNYVMPPIITTNFLENGCVGVEYSKTLEAVGGTVTWSIESGNLPAGLSLNETTGEISGTPTEDGTFTFIVMASCESGAVTKEFTIIIYEEGTVYDPVNVQIVQNMYYNNGLSLSSYYGENINDPSTWTFAVWNDNIPKQITSFSLSYRSLKGVISWVGLTELQTIYLTDCEVTGLDLTGCNKLTNFYCYYNNLYLTLAGFTPAAWSTEIEFGENPTFKRYDSSWNLVPTSAVSYSNGVLTSTDDALDYIYFSVPTGNPNFVLEGGVYATYTNLFDYSPSAIATINALIDNNNLGDDYIKKNEPQNWEWNYLLTWSESIPKQIITLNIGYRPLTGNASLSALTSMQRLDCDYTGLTALNLSNCVSLTELYCGGNPEMTSLNVAGCTALQTLHCAENQLTELNLAGFSNLQNLVCQNNNLTSLDLTGCVNIQQLHCGGNSLIYLDLSQMNSLGYYDYSGYDQHVTLTLTGSETAGYFLEIPLNDPMFNYLNGYMNNCEENCYYDEYWNWICEYFNCIIDYEEGYLKINSNEITTANFTTYTGITVDFYGPAKLELYGSVTFEYIYQQMPPTITTNTLPGCLRGTPYNATLNANGDTPITWSIVSGDFPDGLTLDDETGVITGTPTVADIFNFTVMASNAAGEATKPFSIEIFMPEAPVITTTSLPPALLGLEYTQTLTATGDLPITWSIEEGDLPDGLNFNPATGEISGTATVVDNFTFTVMASNNGGEDTKELTLEVHEITYDSVAVAIINNLITNHNLNATLDAPASWTGFATWDLSSPRQITHLYFSSRPFTGMISLVGLSKLKEITFQYNNQATGLDLSDCTELTNVSSAYNNQLGAVIVSGCNELRLLDCSNNPLTALDLFGCTALQELYISNANLPILNVSGFADLKWLYCSYSNITQLFVSGCASLNDLDCQHNNITELDLTGLNSLQYLTCNHNSLTELDLRNLTDLEYVTCNYNNLFQLYIDITNAKLWGLNCSNNHLSYLDFTGIELWPYNSDLNGQTLSLALEESAPGEYLVAIPLNSPTFGNSAISYSGGILKSTDDLVTSSTFTSLINVLDYAQYSDYSTWGPRLAGTMSFEYFEPQAPTILTPNLTSGFIGMPYTQTLTASGAQPITWSIVSGNLPNGLSLDEETGIISGTPTEFGTFPLTINATNYLGTGTKNLTLFINDCTIAVFPWMEGFEGTFPPSCWKTVNVSGSLNWTKDYAYCSGAAAMHDRGPSGELQENWLISPAIALPNGGIYFLEFTSRMVYQSSYAMNGSTIWISTGTDDPDDFTLIYTLSGYEISSNCIDFDLPISEYAGQTIYVGFRYRGASAHVWFVDNVKILEVPLAVTSFLPPNNAQSVNITPTVRVTFNANITENDLSGVTFGGTPVTPTINGNILDIPLPADYLDFSTTYTISVPANAIVDYNSVITWSFTTVEEPEIILVSSITPANHSRDVALNAPVKVVFNKNISSSNIAAITINGEPLAQTPVMSGLVLNILHEDFDYGTDYTILIPANTINGCNWDITWSFTTTCESITDFPFKEKFSNTEFPPVCWNHFQVSGNAAWERAGLTNPFSPPYGYARIDGRYNYDGIEEAWLVLPKLSLPTTGNFLLEFQSMMQDVNYYGDAGSRYGSSDIMVSTGSPDPAAGNYVLAKHLSGSEVDINWQPIVVPLANYQGVEDIYIAFRYYCYRGHTWNIDEILLYDELYIDVELDSIETPNLARCMDGEQVRVWIRNRGAKTIENIDLKLEVDGFEIATETFPNPLLPFEEDPYFQYGYTSRPYTFTATADLTGSETHTVTVTAITAGDVVPENDALTKTLSSAVTVFPWTETFTSSTFPPQCWEAIQVTGLGLWQRSTTEPQHDGAYAVRLNNGAPYGIEQESWLITRPITIPSTGYVLEFMSYIGNPNYYWGGNGIGRSRVFISTTTNDISQFTELYFLQGAEVATIWQKIRVNLDDYNGETVYLAFVYTGENDHSWRIDDVTVRDFLTYLDAEMISILTPSTGEELTANEIVTVTLKNNSGTPITGFNIRLDLNDIGIALETFPGTIPVNTTAEYTFTTPADFSVYGNYELKASVLLQGDELAGNNSVTKRIYNAPLGTIVDLHAYRFIDNFGSPRGFVSFKNVTPEVVDYVAPLDQGSAYRILYSGEHINGYVYAFTAMYNVFLSDFRFQKILTDNWSIVESTNVNDMSADMTYDYSTGTLYGLVYLTDEIAGLVDINMENGNMKLIGSFGRLAFAMACNLNGELFVVDGDGFLCSVNKETAELTIVGNTELVPENLQTMAFDQNSGRLFWAMLDYPGNSSFVELNPTTGAATHMGSVGGDAQIFCLYSHYTPPIAAVIFMPDNGATNVELDAEVSVRFNQIVTAGNLSGITITPNVPGIIPKILNNKLTIAHGNFEYSTQYTVNVPASAVANLNQEITWSFTTIPHPPYTITATAGENGTISPDGEVLVEPETTPTFTITPNTGYHIETILVDNIPIEYTIDPEVTAPFEYTFEPVEEDHTIAATFVLNCYAMNPDNIISEHTTLVMTPTPCVPHGSNVTFTISVADCYDLQVWIDGVEHGDITTHTITNVSGKLPLFEIVAAKKQFTITASPTDDPMGTITPSGTSVVDCGDDKSFEIKPNIDYKIKDVEVNGESKGAIAAYTFSDVRADATIEAFFESDISVIENDGVTIKIFSHKNVVTILNENLVPIKQVEIMDMYGRIVWSGEAPTEKTEITLHVTTGIYGVRITTNATVFAAKIHVRI